MLNQKVYKIDFNLSKQYVKKLILKNVYVKKISNYYNWKIINQYWLNLWYKFICVPFWTWKDSPWNLWSCENRIEDGIVTNAKIQKVKNAEFLHIQKTYIGSLN